MKFHYSRNQEVRKHVNARTGKISAGGNFKAFNENWEPLTGDTLDIADNVTQGYGLCAWHLIDGKRAKNETGCIKAGLLIIDVDNQADGKDKNGNKIQDQQLDESQAVELEVCKKYLSFAYYSPSNEDNWPRFRLVFGLEKEIIDTGFYQWFTREVSKQIPGSDIRATQVPNLFYGAKENTKLIYISQNFIPASKIDEAYQIYLSLPKESVTRDGAREALSARVDPSGVNLEQLLAATVKGILEGEEVEDRSFAMAGALKEIIGWCNWLNTAGIAVRRDPLDTANQIFENIYEYDPQLDGKFDRILGSITDVASLKPAIAIASETGEAGIWKKIKAQDKALFDAICPDEVKAQIQNQKPKPVNSILTFEDPTAPSSVTPPPVATAAPTSTSKKSKMSTSSTPSSPAQLIQLQSNNRQFSENDIADVIVNNYGDKFLFDSSLDEFFAYDEDEGIWYINDEHHIKRRIVKTLDTFVTAGVLPKYNSATVSSVFHILKAKLLKSIDGGRSSIWKAGRGKIAFKNGVYDAKLQSFENGNQKDLFFQTKLAYDFDLTAKCPEFLKWLQWAVGPDKVILIQAFCRAVLTGYTTGEKFLHLIGAGGSGKSTLQQVLIALSGFSGTHTSDLETIETNRFEAHSLIGKRLLLLTDEASFSKRLDTLKKLTSASDTLRAERKYGTQVINFKPELLVSIASNEHISSSDISSGLERRRLTIVMNNVVPASQRRDLLSVYADRIEGELAPELPGIAAWAINMPFDEMRDVLANPVKYCPHLNATNLEALVFNNPICAWLAECCLYAPNSHTTLGGGAFRPSIDEQERGLYIKNAYQEIYASYANFAKSNGYKAAAKPRFVDRLKETVNNVLKIPGVEPKFINGRAVVQGLRLKPYDISTDRAASGDTRLPSPIEYASNPTTWDAAFAAHDAPKQQSSDDQND
jgi:P4 family phage/plasmid primase-like protien